MRYSFESDKAFLLPSGEKVRMRGRFWAPRTQAHTPKGAGTAT